MPRRESARRKHPLARESDMYVLYSTEQLYYSLIVLSIDSIETLHMRLTLLQMTFSKHIERMHCCFFSGEILDEVHRILNYVQKTPVLSRAYKVTDELFDLSTMAMEYFKEHIEPTLPEINYFAVGDYLLDYSPTLTGSPQTQLSLMENTTKDLHQSTSIYSNKKRGIKSNQNSLESTSSQKNSETIALKKRLKNIEINNKRNSTQIMTLKRELTLAKKKCNQKQRIANTMRTRFDDNDKKLETMNRKLSAVLEELSKCKTELQYWRSTSPSGATPTPSTKLNHCRCGDTPNEIESLLVPEVFKPIDDKQSGGSSEGLTNSSDDTNVGSSVVRVEGKHCKRKLYYIEEKKCDKKFKKD